MKNIFVLSFIVLQLSLVAQSDLVWANQLKGPGNAWGFAITTDIDGNVYTAGSFEGDVDFDPGPGVFQLISLGWSDVFVTKFDSYGNLVWAKQMGGIMFDFCYSIALDNSGNVYTGGTFYGEGDFDPGPGVYNFSNSDHIFISKLDNSGNFVWAKSLCPGGYCGSIAVDDADNLYCVGNFSGTVDFDPGPAIYNVTATSGTSAFVLKMDATGNFLWSKHIERAGAQSVSVDKSNNVCILGQYNDTTDFDPGAGVYNMFSQGSYDNIYVSKLDASGNFLWAKGIGGPGDVEARCIKTGANNEVFLSGRYGSSVDFDPGSGSYNLTAAGSSAPYVCKLDSLGTFNWVKTFENDTSDTDGNCAGRSIALDENNNVYLIGSFKHTEDFDPGPGQHFIGSFGSLDIFVCKLNAAGNLVDVAQLGGTTYDVGTALAADYLGNVYVTGYFTGTADFNPGSGTCNLTSAGGGDVFVCKLNSSISTSIETIPSAQECISIYPNPSTGIFNLKTSKVYNGNICIYDVLGRCILSQPMDESLQIDLSAAGKGIYFVEVETENARINKKIVLN